MSGPALQMTRLRRRFGSVTAVRDVSLHVEEGEIVALLGPNGAGKTTTVKMASTLLLPTSGGVTIHGIDAVRDPRRARAHLGLALGGERGFYLRAGVLENMRFFAELRGAGGRGRDGRILDLLDRVGLRDRARDRVEELSRGMRQRLHIARALLGEPSLVLLDEPSSGLDPESAREIRILIRGLRSSGVAILLTTHDMRECDELADRILIVRDGSIAVEGSAADVARAAGIAAVSTFRVTDPPVALAALIHRASRRVIEVAAQERNGAWMVDVLWGSSDVDDAAILQTLGATATRTISRPATLEESYLALLARRPGPGARA